MKQLPFKKDLVLHTPTSMADGCAVLLYRTCESMKAPHGLFGVGDAVAAQVPGAITRFQPAQTCADLSVPLVAFWHYSTAH